MAATGSTTNYGFATYNPDDITSWLVDFNGNWEKADTELKKLADAIAGGGGSNVNVVQTTGDSTTDVMSQKAVSDAISGVQTAIPNVVQSTGSSQTDVMSQDAVTKAIAAGGGSGSGGLNFTKIQASANSSNVDLYYAETNLGFIIIADFSKTVLTYGLSISYNATVNLNLPTTNEQYYFAVNGFDSAKKAVEAPIALNYDTGSKQLSVYCEEASTNIRTLSNGFVFIPKAN